MSDTPYLLISCDVGGSSDPAALAVALVQRRDRLTKARILHMEIRPPVVSPTDHIALISGAIEAQAARLGRASTRIVVDVSNNSAIASLLAQALPRNSLVGVRISGGEQHAAGLTPLAVGDVNGRATAIPVMTLSRRQLLLDLGVAMQQKLLTLPLDDKAEARSVDALKDQMLRASLKTTASGKQVAVVNRAHDDLLMATAQLWAATKLASPRGHLVNANMHRVRASAPSPAGWT